MNSILKEWNNEVKILFFLERLDQVSPYKCISLYAVTLTIKNWIIGLDYAILELSPLNGLQPSWYMSQYYTMLSKYGNSMCLLKIKVENRWFLQMKSGKILNILWVFFNKPIIPLALVGYEMIKANSYPTRTLGKIVKYSTINFFTNTKV